MHADSSSAGHGTGGAPGDHGPRTGQTASRLVLVALGAALVIGLALAGLLAWAALPQSALVGTPRTPSLSRPASTVAGELSTLYNRISWIAAIIYVLVQGAILYAAFGFRRRSDADPEPAQTHGNNALEVTWTVVPSIIVLSLAFLSYREMRRQYVTDVPDDLVVTATGFRWYWAFEYADKTLGDATQPLTLTTATELVVPVGRPVKVLIESQDVLHALWVPQLAGKRDAVPGDRDGGYGRNYIWFTAEHPGRYEGQCAELCGTWHAGMRFTVLAVEEPAYAAWARAMAQPGRAPADPDSPAGRGFAFVQGACTECHMLDVVDGSGERVAALLQAERTQAPKYTYGGKDANGDPIGVTPDGGTRGPNLTHVASRGAFAGGMFPMDDDHLTRWITNADRLKPGTRMIRQFGDPATVADVIAFLKSMALDPAVVAPLRALGPNDVPADLDGWGELGGAGEEGHGEEGASEDHTDAMAPRSGEGGTR